jgi:hypothetical protein
MMRISLTMLFLFCGITLKVHAFDYTHEYKTEHFVIHYNADSVPSRKDKSYIPHEKIELGDVVGGDPDWVYDKEVFGKKVRAVPYYIVDIGKYLETSLAAYVGMGIASYSKPRSSPNFFDDIIIIRHVYVCPLGTGTTAIEGETNSITGSVFINQNVPISKAIPDKAVALKKTCAHELLHNVTSYYYNGFLVKLSSLTDATSNAWWWESLAPQADRLVWPNEEPYEAELFAMDDQTGIINTIHNSWDVCNKAPDWYISSAFLSYLLYYRPGIKADFSKIFKAPVSGAWNLLSYIRTSLNDYAVSELGSYGLGKEYFNYMLWMLEKSYPNLYLKNEAAGINYVKTFEMKKTNFEPKVTFNMEVPYMSLRMLKIFKQAVVKEKMFTIKNLRREGECAVLVFECTGQGRKLIRELDLYEKKDSMNILHEPGKWTEVGVLSNSLNNASSATVEISRYPDFDGTYEGKVEFSGTNPKLDAMYMITLSSLKFEIKEGEVTCDFEFHKHYKKDGFYAKGIQLKGKIDPTGIVKVTGSVKGFSYPKGCINCCDFPRVIDDPKCFKMNHNPYYWKFEGKVIVTDDNKASCKGFIAAGTGPDRFMKASEKLYAFSADRK